MPKTFAVPDIHGQLGLLESAIAEIEARVGSGTVVFLGDYVDRGPHSRQVVERLMAGPPEGWRWVCLMGNHERTIVRSISRKQPVLWLTENGGGATLLSYGHPREGRLDYSVIPASHLEWMASLPLYYADRHRLFVHAGADPALPLDAHDPRTLLHMKYPRDDEGGYQGLHVVHGHRPHPAVTLRYRTALDAVPEKSGRFLVAEFDDDRPGGPTDLIELALQDLATVSAV